MRQGGRYLVEKPGQKPKRVAWTRTPAEAAAERRAEAAKRREGKAGDTAAAAPAKAEEGEA